MLDRLGDPAKSKRDQKKKKKKKRKRKKNRKRKRKRLNILTLDARYGYFPLGLVQSPSDASLRAVNTYLPI